MSDNKQMTKQDLKKSSNFDNCLLCFFFYYHQCTYMRVCTVLLEDGLYWEAGKGGNGRQF